MPVKIRLMRIGAKKRPFFRIVAIDERKKRKGAYLDLIGTYNPLTEPKEIRIDQNKVEEWKKKGAVLSDGFLRITKQAPQKPPRKPKKAPAEPKEAPKAAPPVEEAAAAEENVSEQPVEEASTETVETPESSPAAEETTQEEEQESDNQAEKKENLEEEDNK